MIVYCERCKKEAEALSGSIFNTDSICKHCRIQEHEHHLAHEAKQSILEHVKNGDYCFPGIGLPKELIPKP